jgi:hypothetical protein
MAASLQELPFAFWYHKIAGSSSPYNPATDSSVVEWLKADAITGVSNGTSFSIWPHSIGNDAIKPSAASQPTYSTGQQNKLPAVQFAAGSPNQAMTISGFGVLSQPYSVWVVYKFYTLNAGGNQLIFDGLVSNNRTILENLKNDNRIGAFAGGTALDTSQVFDSTSYHTAYLTFNGASSTYAFDGASSTTFTGNIGTLSMSGLTLGDKFDFSLPGDCYIGELLVQNAIPSNPASIFTYFRNRWATY